MLVRVTDAKLIRDFAVWVRFNDGVEGETTSRTNSTGRCSNR